MSQSVAVLGSNQVPLTYQVPVPGTLTALTAAATFDGTAAATFVPCLSFYDSDGNLLSRATASTVAAGASAEVSWFPRVAAPASNATVSTVGAWGHVVYSAGSWPNQPGEGTATVPFVSSAFDTSDPSIFAYGTSGGHGGLKINADGLYLVFTTSECNSSSAPAANACLQVSPDGISFDSVVTQFTQPFFEQDASDFLAQAEWTVLVEISSPGQPPGTLIQLDVGQNSGHSVSLTAGIYALKVGG